MLFRSAAVLLGGTYGAGYVRAKHTCTTETTQMQLTHTAQRLAAEQEYGVKLAAAAAEKQHWYDLSQRQSIDTRSKGVECVCFDNVELRHRHPYAHTQVFGKVVHPHIVAPL